MNRERVFRFLHIFIDFMQLGRDKKKLVEELLILQNLYKTFIVHIIRIYYMIPFVCPFQSSSK